MVETIQVQGKNGPEAVKACWFILNECQQFVTIGYDGPKAMDIDPDHPDVKCDYMGRLLEQNPIFQMQAINSLIMEGWDFDTSGNPQLFLLTDKRK